MKKLIKKANYKIPEKSGKNINYRIVKFYYDLVKL
jgi:hypothetical protein